MAISWYGELSRDERHTFWACLGGYTLDSLDSQIYALLAPILITALAFSKPEIGALTTTGLMGNALGGWIAGIAADRFGRKRLLQITILWVAGFSGLAALCTSHTEFFIVRFLQGMGFGGEAAVAGVLVGEVVRAHLRGRVVTSTQAGYGLGYAIALIAMPILFASFSEALAWRLMFAVGFVPALLALYVGRFVPESHAYATVAAERDQGASVAPFWTIFNAANWRSSLTGVLLSTGVLGGGFGIHAWLPTYLSTSLHLHVMKTAGYLSLSVAGLVFGPLVGGYLADAVGRRTTFLVLIPIHALVVAALLFMHPGVDATLALIFLQGSLQGAVAGTMLPTFTELFRTDIRASGVGFCITGGRGIGSICTSIVGLMAATMPLNQAMGATTLCAFALAIVAALLLPDRSGIAIED